MTMLRAASTYAVTYIAVFAAAIALLLYMLIDRRRRLGALPIRKDMTIDALHSFYYGSSAINKEDFRMVWSDMAAILQLPAGKIRPTDRFGKNIGGGILVTPELDALQEWASKKLHARNKSNDLSGVVTVDDYVRLLADGST